MEKLKTTKTQLGNEICLIGAKSAPRRESKVLIIGVFHGDEPQGKFLIEEYLKQISDETSKNLLFIPCLNPDGMLAGTRTNAAGVDLNRNFPTRNWGEDTSKAGPNAADYFGGKSAGSEIETGFCIDVINEYKPKAILTLHAPYKIVNFDGPARELAEKISVNGTSAIIMFHTHPNGEVEPSRQDLETTQTILNVCTLLKISFCDHVILNETTHYSFGKHGDVARMYQNFANMFANQPIKPILRQIQCFTYD